LPLYEILRVVIASLMAEDGKYRTKAHEGLGKVETMLATLKKLWRDESGQDMLEYALLCAALVIIVAGFFPPALGQNISQIFSKVSSQMNGS